MTTDHPLPESEFEDVRIENWQTRLPSTICTNKEVFDEIFSLETWKSVLQPEQRDRILKLLPPEILKSPSDTEKVIADLFSKNLVRFGTNPLDTLFDKLINGHYDPEVVETKSNIVREWRRESLRLKKQYHTKLLQDIVISREKHLSQLVPDSPIQKRNGKKSASSKSNSSNTPNRNNSSTKKNVKSSSTNVTLATATNGIAKTNGVTAGSEGKSNGKLNRSTLKIENTGLHTTLNNTSSKSSKSTNQGRNKRGRLEAALLSPTSSSKDAPASKKAKSANSKAKSTTNKKTKDEQKIFKVEHATSSHSSPLNTSSPSLVELVGNGPSQKKSLLLGTLTTGITPNEPPTLSLKSPASVPGPPTSLLESLTSPINPPAPTLSFGGNDASSATTVGIAKTYSKLFPSTFIPSSPISSSSSSSYLPSPVHSSPILASQLQAPSPSPISVNLNSITGLGSVSSRNLSGTGSPSHSSITLNYTQAPLAPHSAAVFANQQGHSKSILEDESSSDEFEFDAIEPTIGFSGPPPNTSSTSSAILKSPQVHCQTVELKKGPISPQELANIQKCSLLTNCLTQPLPPNSSSNAAVSAELANNILTSTGGTHQTHLPQHSQKIIVTSGGALTTSAGFIASQQQLHKFLTSQQINTSTALPAQKLLAQQLNMFQQQQLLQKEGAQSSTIDPQTLVRSIMSSSKDLLTTFGASSVHSGTSSGPLHQAIQQSSLSHSNPNVLPISVNVQSGTQQGQMKQATIVRVSSSAIETSGLLQGQQAPPHPIVPLTSQQVQSSLPIVIGQGSTLNTQNVQLPSSILSGDGGAAGNGNHSVTASKPSSSSLISSAIPSLLDSDDLNNLNLSGFSLGSLSGMNLDMSGVSLSDLDTSGVGQVGMDAIKLEMDCAIDKMDDLTGVLDGNPFDSIPNLSDELDGLDLDMVDGLCDFEGLLSEEKQYASFFSLVRDVLCSTRDHRMTLVCLEKTIRKWQISAAAALNPWYMRVADWTSALIMALNFLAGNYQDVHPEDFVPYIEYKYKTKYYQWIGAGRDGDNNLTPLYSLWMDNIERLPPLKKSDGDCEEPEEEEDENEDSDTAGGGESSEVKKKTKRPQTPPPPRCTTDWTVRPSTVAEKELFRQQEKARFDNPHKAFTYKMHDYESVVGPVKGVYSSQSGVTNKARGHSLLVDDRPPYVTILALVRDAVARLPNGEGTRSEICEMLRDSTFLAPEASIVTLNSVVSGALDRLHYERDPCVRYDSHKKSWIYLHRDRTQEQFERLHHNRSYTKSTKSRNNSNRKSRKGGSKSSTSSVSSATPSEIMGNPQSCSTSPSQTQGSGTYIESLGTGGGNSDSTVAAIVGLGSGGGGIVSTASGSTTISFPPLSTSNNSKAGNVANSGPTGTGITLQKQNQGVKPAIGIVNVTTGGRLQQQKSNAASMPIQMQGGQGLITMSGVQQSSNAPFLNEMLATASGLRLQSGTGEGTPVIINQSAPQGKQQSATIIQDANGHNASARLVVQQGALSSTGNQQPSQTASMGLQMQQIQQTQMLSGSQGAIGAGQILLGSSAAVLKLAGNIRLGEGVRLAQLRLPSGNITVSPGSSLPSSTSSPLRLPQHRILLTRGTLPGQPQTQGVLLGQTSTGQTVILSTGPPGASSLTGLQSLTTSGASGSSNQITLHAPVSQSLQLDSSLAGNTNLQQNVQSLNTQGVTRVGIIKSTSPINTIMVSSGSSNSLPQSTSVTYSGSDSPRIQQILSSGQGPTLPPTSIALPASILSSGSGHASSSNNGAGHVPLVSNIASTPVSQHQPSNQLVITSGGPSPQQTATGASVQLGLGQTPSSLSQIVQQNGPQRQNVMMTSSSPHQSNTQLLGQSQSHSLTSPIIIRSAQGDFVSFGIPSNLSLGKGVQGIKVIPFQAGKQLLARIVPPPSQSGAASGNGTATVGMLGETSTTLSSSSHLPTSTTTSLLQSVTNTGSNSGITSVQLPVQQQSINFSNCGSSGKGVSGSVALNNQSSNNIVVSVPPNNGNGISSSAT